MGFFSERRNFLLFVQDLDPPRIQKPTKEETEQVRDQQKKHEARKEAIKTLIKTLSVSIVVAGSVVMSMWVAAPTTMESAAVPLWFVILIITLVILCVALQRRKK